MKKKGTLEIDEELLGYGLGNCKCVSRSRGLL